MSDYELVALLAAIASASGERTSAGAVAYAREILDELRRQEPEAYAAHMRARLVETQRRAREAARV